MLNKQTSKQVNILLLQHNNPYAVALERQIFAEALECNALKYVSEKHFTVLRKFFSKRKIQNFIGGITKSLILNNTDLEHYLKNCFDNNQKPVVIFLNSLFTEIRYPEKALVYLKKRYNACFILYYIDTIDREVSTYSNYLREKGVFDYVYTFDKCDAEKYNLLFWQTPYSAIECKSSNCKDLYFSGVDADRVKIINDISKVKNLNFEMDIIHIDENSLYEDSRINVHSMEEIMPYREVIDKTVKSKCILEIIRPGQIGFTLRTFEAVVYNKKLLTNNTNIINFNFYNPKYMKIFNNVDDIDWDWVKDYTNVNYNYDGSFSPVKFIEEINNKICQKEST